MPKTRYLPSKLAIALMLSLPALSLASTPVACQISPLAQHIMPEQNISKAQLFATAEHGTLTPTDGDLYGNVQVYHGDDRLESDHFNLDRINQVITSDGKHVLYSSPSTVLEGTHLTHRIDQRETDVTNAKYYLKATPNIQGRAVQIEHRDNESNTLLKNATYSTCTVDNEIWSLDAKELDIDHVAGRAEAYDATFDVFGVPVLYTPYLSFPIDGKRHSGFLFPELEISRSNGTTFFLPYYFNIAPNMDATIAAGVIAKRGIAVKGNYRYLNEWQMLTLDGTYLFKDKQFDHKKRWMLKAEQELNFDKNLTGNILFQNVSDDQYTKDLGRQTGLFEEVTLERHAVLNYRTEHWTALLRFQDFVVTDRGIVDKNPYGRLPQLLFQGGWDFKGLGFELYGELVHFSAKNDRYLKESTERPRAATRLDLMPTISYRLENTWGFIEPAARFRYTQYHLNYHNKKYQDGNKTSLSRSMPILSLDTGFFLDKDLQLSQLFGGGDFTQTFEPRLFYLYAPYRKQGDIPIFDTSKMSSSFDNLFNFNDFYGADRQSNANRLTASVTTRLVENKSGIERLYFSLGQTRYFTAPRITMGKDRKKGENEIRKSALTAETGIAITRSLYTKANFDWSPTNKLITYGTFDLNYRPSSDKIFSVSYQYNRPDRKNSDKTDQIDTSFYWNLNNKWAIAGRYNYILSESKMIDSQLGFEFRDCCVTTRVAARYYRQNVRDDEKQWRVYVEFDLNGIGSVGQNTDGLWKDSIKGYSSRQGKFF
ncbi:LPS assembly protein LptD [Ignatzschineria indica]|uniref:LPS-assembly protein LptD n=1 Tax=Ignatzschineria indica TaxID=472583 RepID=UPI0025779A8E|nr:LPS assembly protein LptD [Ignatzschineria indica]MDM1544709.1 LPS assembly protein LptD [Ignatzschineria indica]